MKLSKPYNIVKLNDNFYVEIGPFGGLLNNSNDYVYILLESNDNIQTLYSEIKSVNSYDELLNILTNYIDVVNFYITNDLFEIFRINEEELDEETLEKTNLLNIIDNSNIEYIDNVSNLNKFIIRNKLTFSEEDLLSLPVTFAKIILDLSDNESIDFSNIYNVAYKKTLEYFSNYQNDAVLNSLTVILETIAFDEPTTSYSSCGCNSTDISNSSSIIASTLNGSMTCVEKYKYALGQWLKKMLSDIDFYNEWMMIVSDDEVTPNESLIDNLINLLNEFLLLDLDLSFGNNRNHCNCGIDKESTTSLNNKEIINNYIRVLNWIKNCEIEENTNKIKLYGENFGELLPNLIF